MTDKLDLIKKLKNSGTVNYFLLNLDNFSNINLAYGYDIGDKVLSQVSKYLNIAKPKNATLYQFGAASFVLVDERELDKKGLIYIAESLLSFFSQTDIYIGEEIEFRISFSIGISVDKGLVNITQAESAIRELRELQRHSYKIFDPLSRFHLQEEKNIYWILRIKEAVDDEKIVPYYQPIIDNVTGKIVKYECLARIKDADEIISPYMFMDAARVTGNLSFVTKSLITQSFKNFSGTEYEFSINITVEDLMLNYLELFLLQKLKKFDIRPEQVILEMLEEITSLDVGTTLAQLNSLREKGFKIAIDDFGAESSNMSRLMEIHPDYLKIDGVFIKNLDTDRKSQIIVEGIIYICRKSGIKIIAEYVHSKEILEMVKSYGIDYSQGYYLGEPKPYLVAL